MSQKGLCLFKKLIGDFVRRVFGVHRCGGHSAVVFEHSYPRAVAYSFGGDHRIVNGAVGVARPVDKQSDRAVAFPDIYYDIGRDAGFIGIEEFVQFHNKYCSIIERFAVRVAYQRLYTGSLRNKRDVFVTDSRA